jgi:uncharacterized protein YdeI (YjbR/CyaY-like superfamily)
MKPAAKELPIKLFKTKAEWAGWLEKNQAKSPGLWLRIAKKASGKQSVTYDEALEVALCYGWIDGQKKTYDEVSWLQRFTPRGAKSMWSKINRHKAEALIVSRKMKPSGLAQVERARQDGRWDRAYDSQRRATVPPDLQAELDRNVKAGAFFATLDGANRYAVLFRIEAAKKPETRARRIRQFIEMLEKGRKLYP